MHSSSELSRFIARQRVLPAGAQTAVRHVLIVDDNPDKTLALQSVLEELSCEVVVAASPEAGLRELLKRDFDLALLDIQMPGMDGFELAKLIRSRPAHADLGIVFMSAIDQTEDRLENAYALGAFDFIALPARRAVIKAKVAALLGLHTKARTMEVFADETLRRLHATQNRFARLLAKAEDIAIFFLNGAGLVEEWSHGAELQTGWSAEEMVGRSYSVLFVPGDVADHVPAEKMASAANGEQGGSERWLLRKDGSRFWARFSLVALGDTAADGYGVILRDVSAPRRTQQELEIKSEVLESMGESVCVVDDSFQIVYANPAALRMFGYEADELIGTDVRRLNDFEPEENAARVASLMEHFKESRLWVGEWLNRRKTGDRFVTHTRLSAFEHDGRKHFVCVQEDPTPRKQAEAAVERSRQLEDVVSQLEAFSYSIAHDIRAPLRAVQGFADTVVAEYGDALKGPGIDYMNRIRAATERLEKMVSDILAFSRVSHAELSLVPIELGSLFRALIEETPGFRSPNAEVAMIAPLPAVLGDESSLRQVLTNLLSNAVKFVPAGRRPVVKIRAELQRTEATVWIEDNGIGIRAEDQTRIFEAFERANHPTAFPGSGIGLSIVKRMVGRMGGSVGVVSELGAGSRFWIKLPLVAGPEAAT